MRETDGIWPRLVDKAWNRKQDDRRGKHIDFLFIDSRAKKQSSRLFVPVYAFVINPINQGRSNWFLWASEHASNRLEFVKWTQASHLIPLLMMSRNLSHFRKFPNGLKWMARNTLKMAPTDFTSSPLYRYPVKTIPNSTSSIELGQWTIWINDRSVRGSLQRENVYWFDKPDKLLSLIGESCIRQDPIGSVRQNQTIIGNPIDSANICRTCDVRQWF